MFALMSRVQFKSYGFALLLVFTLMTIGSVPGFAWCIGQDGHIEIEFAAAGDCCVGSSELTITPNGLSDQSVHIDQDHCGPCLDLFLQCHNVVSVNRFHKDTVVAGFCIENDIVAGIPSAVKLLLGNLVPQPPPRISQAILAHRTTVLLI